MSESNLLRLEECYWDEWHTEVMNEVGHEQTHNQTSCIEVSDWQVSQSKVSSNPSCTSTDFD
jgi:hypothetical protein